MSAASSAALSITGRPTRLVSPSELSEMLSRLDVVVIDISTAKQFVARHIQGSRPGQVVHGWDFWSHLLLDETGGLDGMLEVFVRVFQQLGLSGDETLVFVEDSPADGLGQSCRGAFISRLLGWDPAKLFILNGGTARWNHEGFPVESGTVTTVPAASPPALRVHHALLADLKEVAAIARGLRPGVVLLDCRGEDEWAGLMPAPGGQDPKLPPGRIPGAINLNWDVFFTGEQGVMIEDLQPAILVAAERMSEIVRELQLHPHTPIVLYCYKGARASVVYKVLVDFLGFTDVRMYFGGWADYARHKQRVPFEHAAVLPSVSRTFGQNRPLVAAFHRRSGKLARPERPSGQADGYQTIDMGEIEGLTRLHQWIVEPLFRASDHVRHTPFFHWLSRLDSPQEFKPAAMQLWGHSATFPQVMGAMLACNPLAMHRLMGHYAQHLIEEVEHHNWLEEWMLAHGLIGDPAELVQFDRTPETNACVNLGWSMVAEGDAERWMCCLNSAIERLSNDFFRVLAQRMHELGAGHRYFDVHVGADQFHSIMGLRHVTPREPGSAAAKHLIHCALEGVKTWCDMLHSWIGHPYRVQFDEHGFAIHQTPLLGAVVEWNG